MWVTIPGKVLTHTPFSFCYNALSCPRDIELLVTSKEIQFRSSVATSVKATCIAAQLGDDCSQPFTLTDLYVALAPALNVLSIKVFALEMSSGSSAAEK